MKGDTKVIEYLNAALRSELTAVSQYWLHYRLQEDWGYGRIADKSRAESIEEMHHADRLIQRIIFLEGHPNLQKLDPLRIGETVKEILEAMKVELVHEGLRQKFVPDANCLGECFALGKTAAQRLAERVGKG